jgi:hypothetical protein
MELLESRCVRPRQTRSVKRKSNMWLELCTLTMADAAVMESLMLAKL